MNATRTFALEGRTEISRIGVGTNRIADDARSREFLAAAVDAGADFFDTAELYSGGMSEIVIGQVLGADERAVIATKGGYHDASPESIAKSLEQSRVHLQRDVIDLYYLHRPGTEIPIEQSVDPILAARQDGRVKHIGLSNVTLDQVDRVRKLTPVAAVQNLYNAENSNADEMIEYCERHAIAFVPFFPLRGAARAKKVAKRLDAPRTQVVLAAMLARSGVIVPIPGTRNIEHLRSNVAAAELELPAGAAEELGFSADG